MALILFAFWVILNGRLTWEIAWIGALITALGMLFLCACCDWSLRREGGLYRSVPLLIGYAFTVIVEIVKANLKLCRVVYRGTPDPVVRAIPTALTTRMARMVLANSITLTPGTITLACREGELVIHCLTPDMADGLDDTVFERKLRRIEEALHG
ncbi:MAG: Na+/H+ antiporter subunit E [Clostridia bacterium]|nr:Na+/H+ antiporter subunit E [Clostridia bacterium]